MNMKNISRQNLVIVLLGLVLAIIIAILAIFYIDFDLDVFENEPQSSDFREVNRNIVISEIRDTKTASINTKTVTLPDGFEYTTTGLVTNTGNFECQTEDDQQCSVYIASNGEIEYLISTPNNVTKQIRTGREVRQSVEVRGRQYNFGFQEIETLDTTDTPFTEIDFNNSETINVYEQAFGCVEDEICFSALELDISIEENQNELDAFYEFINDVVIE